MSKSYKDFSKEELIVLLEKQAKELKIKKYGLVWDSEKEPEKVVLDCENNLPILKKLQEKEIKTDDSEDNILIEGDNYHALTVLNYTHKENIDVIYIDPPYNTGNKDFIYNDKFVDKEDGYRHSKWLNFMEKRLNIAKELLKDTGVIFISIDDNEHTNLKLLCDKIFGGKNFVSNVIIQSNPRGSQASIHLADVHEYILIYAKNIDLLQLKGLEKNVQNLSEYKNKDENGYYRELGLRQRGGEWRREQRLKMYYPIYINPETGEVSLAGCSEFSVVSLPQRPSGEDGRWTWSKEKFLREKHLLIGKKVNRQDQENFYDIFRKDYLLDTSGEEKTSKVKTIWTEKHFNYQNGRDSLKEILGEDLFDYPKPVEIISRILKMAMPENGIILDFFAGSGTTGDAVLRMNNDEQTNYKFILCTNNENDICQKITYPRISNIINGYSYNGKSKTTLYEKKITSTDFKKNLVKISKGINYIISEYEDEYDKIEIANEDNLLRIIGIKNISESKEGLSGNLQYFRTDFVKNSQNIEQLKINLTKKCTEMLCVKENIFNLKEEKEDFKIFESNKKDKFLCVYYNFLTDSFDEFLKSLADLKGEKVIYMFSMNDQVDETLFEYIQDYKIEAIPQKILDIYKKLIKMNIKKVE